MEERKAVTWFCDVAFVGKCLDKISKPWLNFESRPILCTRLCSPALNWTSRQPFVELWTT